MAENWTPRSQQVQLPPTREDDRLDSAITSRFLPSSPKRDNDRLDRIPFPPINETSQDMHKNENLYIHDTTSPSQSDGQSIFHLDSAHRGPEHFHIPRIPGESQAPRLMSSHNRNTQSQAQAGPMRHAQPLPGNFHRTLEETRPRRAQIQHKNLATACVPTRSTHSSPQRPIANETQINAAVSAASHTGLAQDWAQRERVTSHGSSKPGDSIPPIQAECRESRHGDARGSQAAIPQGQISPARKRHLNVGTIYAELERTRRELHECRAREKQLEKDYEALRAKYERRGGSTSSTETAKHIAVAARAFDECGTIRAVKGEDEGVRFTLTESRDKRWGMIEERDLGMKWSDAERVASFWRAKVERLKRAERRRSDSKVDG
ncbi:hypothetical protein P152DRAFT_455902 [Eremomyces bilateralis CBS 781.70]|uniref:Uncharacterized protein n=1 Tax=Eremomyces bilateralis CBS 781.70 TaxID=1392243 RepID=A0A6G1G9V9_9PEZI|nr:uncharacterized protein P152DRAFT_455902 [Eremomyces bilateralis CBS 781.70]KAF1814865.1 hypothetical protein P152DRAFT_455902 [Eremomyces bilateralis CBS 781.70]